MTSSRMNPLAALVRKKIGYGQHLALGLCAAIALIGCGGPTIGTLENPRTVDGEGRPVVAAKEAVSVFKSACYSTGGTLSGAKNFAQRNGYKITSDGSGFVFSASDPSRSISVFRIDAGICSVNFDAGIPNANAGGQAAQQLISEIRVTGMTGRKGGGQINFKTAKGTVIIGNNARARGNIKGASISLYKL